MPQAAAADCSDSVRVAVRIRPQTGYERVEKCKDCVSANGDMVIIGDRRFTFDYVFDQSNTQLAIYQSCVKTLVDASFSGYNATVLAYGQTGSGKTYSMGSGSWTSINPNELGMIPRAFSDMFGHTDAARAAGIEVSIRVSFIEIHNEELRDLLDSGYKSNHLAIREDAEGGIFVAGAEEREVTCLDEILGHLERGTGCRSTASTHMNEHSSRSHAIFTVQVEQRKEPSASSSARTAPPPTKPITEETPLPSLSAPATAPPPGFASIADAGVSDYVTSKFHFVDLAGSERVKRTRAEGDRLKEGIHINCGLLSLGNVISALGDDKKRAAVSHVPYRDSKLTRLLQDSLGGNARTLMIACISPADINFEETLNTLKYANRARNITNKAVINRDAHASLIAGLRREISQLKMQLRCSDDPENHRLLLTFEGMRMNSSPPRSASAMSGHASAASNQMEVLQLKEENKRLSALVETLQRQLQELSMSRDSLQLAFADLVSNGESSFLAVMDPTGEHALQKYSDVVQGYTQRIRMLEEQLRESGAATSQAASAGMAVGTSCAGGAVPVPEVIAEDELVVIRHRLQGELNSIDGSLVEKERLLGELMRSQKEFESMKHSFESKLQEMQNAIGRTTHERDRVLADMERIEQSVEGATASERERFTSKLKALEGELASLKRQLRDHERLVQFRAQGATKIKLLQTEVDKLRTAKEDLLRRLRVESKVFREQTAIMEKQLVALRREDAKSKKNIRDLEGKLHGVKEALSRKADAASHSSSSVSSASTAPAFVSPRRAARGGAAAVAGESPLREGVGPAMDSTMDAIARCLQQRDARKVLDESKRFQKQLEVELLELMQQKASKQNVADDHVEYLQAELDFRASEIKRAQQQLDDGDPIEDFVTRINRLSIQDLRKLARGFFDSTLGLQASSKRFEEMQKQQELLLAEGRRELDQEKQSRLLFEREADARLTKAQREYEQKVLFLFSQMPQEASAVSAEPSLSEGSADSDARHQQVLADTHRLLELKREQVCILNAENDKQRELVADLEKRLEAERSSHSQSRAAAEEREAELMKKLTESRSSRAHVDSGRGLVGKGGDTSDSSSGTRDLYTSLSLSSKFDGNSSRTSHSVLASASPKLSSIKSLPMHSNASSSTSAPTPTSTFSTSIASLPSRPPSQSAVFPVQDVSGNIAIPASGAASALRAPPAASDQQLFQRHITLTSGGAVAAASDVSHAVVATQQGQQQQAHAQPPLLDAPTSPSRSATATSADGDSDMTTLIVDIQRLWSELGVSPSVELAAMMDCTLLGATQNSHAKDSVHAPQLKENSATLHVLCLIRSKLHDLKRQRKERLGELLQVLTGMWDRLSVPVEYRARFVEKHPTLTQEVLDAYEDEVRRQRHHIKVAINAARTRIETAWRELNAKQQERDTLIAALEALGPGDEAAALELMSVESHRLESRVAANRRILALAKRREDVGHRLKLFENGDEERRNSGAGVQLQEERLRRTLQREMPRITDELRALLEQWEASESASFMLNGVPLLQALNASGGSAHVVTSP